MSDRRPSKLWKDGERVVVAISRDGDPVWLPKRVEASPADLLAVVRRGVESGTIKGEVVETEDCVSEHRGHSSMEVFDLDPGIYIVGPVSDGGSET